jgi:hypothetical protein
MTYPDALVAEGCRTLAEAKAEADTAAEAARPAWAYAAENLEAARAAGYDV